MQKILIGFFFENKLQWQYVQVKKKFLQKAVLGYLFIYVQIKHEYTIPYMYLGIGETFKP
jgi:branched-subunit amino acid transport protein AzlD